MKKALLLHILISPGRAELSAWITNSTRFRKSTALSCTRTPTHSVCSGINNCIDFTDRWQLQCSLIRKVHVYKEGRGKLQGGSLQTFCNNTLTRKGAKCTCFSFCTQPVLFTLYLVNGKLIVLRHFHAI